MVEQRRHGAEVVGRTDYGVGCPQPGRWLIAGEASEGPVVGRSGGLNVGRCGIRAAVVGFMARPVGHGLVHPQLGLGLKFVQPCQDGRQRVPQNRGSYRLGDRAGRQAMA